MAIVSNILPSKCCCCSLRAGSIVIGSFSLIVALTFLGLSATASSLMNLSNCKYKYDDENKWSYICVPLPETYKMVANVMTLLSILSAVEVVMSIGLIWGASKRILNWVTAWLITSSCWILLHAATAIAYLFATQEPAWIILISVIGTLVLGMALLSMLTVLSFRKEIKSSLLLSSKQESPINLSTASPEQQDGWLG